ncbi:MAG: alpha-L-rhamnosidase, partial [Actinobacteria bacterium]|nr:alpha-L-rhamnosidase [Actinomycetota bacterium]
AYELLLQREHPSWLYPVTMGATTIWERWDSMLPDGSLNTGMMTSFNHYALGAVVDWLYQVVAGIQPSEPGYSAVRFTPTPGPGLTHARATLDSPHGRIECGWHLEGASTVVDVSVPDGVRAELVTFDGHVEAVPSGRHTYQLEKAPGTP